jgi:methyl-accepting chemotaxis protein
MLIDENGSFIVHPFADMLMKGNVMTVAAESETAKEAAQVMMSGETGYRSFKLDGEDFYVFYKPFQRESVMGRSEIDLKWSAGMIYPEDDIFGDYKRLSYLIIAIAGIGLMLLYLISRVYIHRQMKPLLMLAEKAQLIAKGNYDETIPDSHQTDEIGRLQNNFQQMQQSLAIHIGALEKLKTQLQEHGEELRIAYQKAQKADRMKTAFLHNMTNQMTEPAQAIVNDVEALRSGENQDLAALTTDIEAQGQTIATLLDNLIKLSDEDFVKGGGV